MMIVTPMAVIPATVILENVILGTATLDSVGLGSAILDNASLESVILELVILENATLEPAIPDNVIHAAAIQEHVILETATPDIDWTAKRKCKRYLSTFCIFHIPQSERYSIKIVEEERNCTTD